MRRSDRTIWTRLAVAGVLAAVVAGCSPRRLVVVDPDPCADGGAPGCLPLSLLDGLIGFWQLDEHAGATTAFDASTRGNRGLLVDLDPNTAWVPGRAGGGLRDDALGYILVDRSTSIDSITDQVTIAAWIYYEGSIVIPDWGTAISRQIGDTYDQHYHLSLNNEEHPSMFLRTQETSGVFLSAGAAVPPKTWVHLAGTYDGANGRLYVNGELVDSRPLTGTFAADTTPLILAGNGNSTNHMVTERFPGRVDEIMLYRRALTADEVMRLHAGAQFPPGTLADAGTSD